MSYKISIVVLLSFFIISQGYSQSKKVTVRGSVTNYNEKPIEAVQIFVDFVRTSEESNKRGNYKLKIASDTKLITVYSPEYGYINWKYSGERKVDFVFSEFSEPISKIDFQKLGYTTEVPKKNNDNWYGEYTSVLEILDKRFSQVRVNDGKIIVGRGGVHSFNGNSEPLILLDNTPVPISSLTSISTFDIEKIRVIHKGSELAQYGFQGNNGVILITLKTGGNEE